MLYLFGQLGAGGYAAQLSFVVVIAGVAWTFWGDWPASAAGTSHCPACGGDSIAPSDIRQFIDAATTACFKSGLCRRRFCRDCCFSRGKHHSFGGYIDCELSSVDRPIVTS